MTNLVTAAIFYFGGMIMKNAMEEGPDPDTGVYRINPADVFTAMFAIMWGASHAGAAAAFGPDMGKARAAAERIYKIKN